LYISHLEAKTLKVLVILVICQRYPNLSDTLNSCNARVKAQLVLTLGHPIDEAADKGAGGVFRYRVATNEGMLRIQ
jgi:hypothetical protein